jgi:methionyl-tRNA formyltransferase
VEKMDAGPAYLQRAIPIAPDDTQATLKEKIAELGASATLEAIDLAARDALVEVAQDETLATYTSIIKKENAVVDWSAPAVQIERMTRAYDPWPVARSRLGSEEMMIWRAAVENADSSDAAPGTIVSVAPYPIVQCGVGRLRLNEVQAPGRKRIPAADFFRGKRIATGVRLG